MDLLLYKELGTQTVPQPIKCGIKNQNQTKVICSVLKSAVSVLVARFWF